MKFFLLLLFSTLTIIAQPKLDSLLTAIQEEDDTTQIKTLGDLCWAYRSKAPDIAIQYGLAALDKMESVNNLQYRSEILNFLGVIYGNLGTLDSAYYYYQQAIEVAKADNDSVQIAYSLNNIGDYYYKNALYSMALEKIFAAYDIFEQIDNKHGMAYCLNDIGEIYVKQNDFDKALEYFLRSGRIRLERNDQRGYAKSLINIASIYVNTKQNDNALKTYNDALAKSNESGYIKGKSWALAGIGDIYLEQGDYKKALDKRYETLAIDLEIGNKYGEIINYNQIGLIYIRLGNLYKAREFLNKAKAEAAKTGHLDQLMITYDYLRIMAFIKKDYGSAYKYFTEYEMLKDSIFSHTNANMIADLQTAFITERKGRENEILKREIEYEKDTRNYLLLISILILIGGVLYVSKYKSEKKANQLLNELNSSKDKFFSIIAHDLKNPVGAVSNIAEYLNSDYNEIAEDEKKELIAGLADASQEIQNLLIDLLTWARTQRGYININKTELNLESLLASIKTSYRLFAKNKNISLKIDCSKELNFTGDKFIIETVIGNLLNNAIKFSYQNSKVIISAKTENEEMLISVTDFGQGMDEKTLNQIFKLDSKISTTGTNNERGTGLGLVICKEFIDLHGGAIEVKSKKSEGSTFTAKIPLT